jgi:hypothetical protein
LNKCPPENNSHKFRVLMVFDGHKFDCTCY